MLFKKYLTNMAIHLKTIKMMALVPPVLLYAVLFPVFLRACLSGIPEAVNVIIGLSNLFIPLFSIWWILMCLREFVESDGNELLFSYGKKSQTSLAVSLMLLYLACEGVLLGFCCFFFPSLVSELLHVSSVCILYAGFAYFCIFLTRSVALTLPPVLLYAFLPSVWRHSGRNQAESLLSFLLTNFILPAVLGVIFLLIGRILNKKFIKYN